MNPVSEAYRRIDNLAQFGTVSEVKDGTDQVRVAILDRVTRWMPAKMFASPWRKHYIPPRVGEQVLVVCPGGKAECGVVLRGLFNTGCPVPGGAGPDTEVLEWPGGGRITYDGEEQRLILDFPGGVIVNGAVKATSGMTVTGDVSVDGSVDASGSVIDAGGNTNHHSHQHGLSSHSSRKHCAGIAHTAGEPGHAAGLRVQAA